MATVVTIGPELLIENEMPELYRKRSQMNADHVHTVVREVVTGPHFGRGVDGRHHQRHHDDREIESKP